MGKGNKSVLFRSHRRNLNVARRRGLPNSTVRSLASRVRSVTQRNKNKANEADKSRIKMSSKVAKLREINRQLKKALDMYIEELDNETVSSPLMDAVSALLDDIRESIEQKKDELDGFTIEEDNQYEYVDELSDFIDDSVIHGYKKAPSSNIRNRVKNSEIIINVLVQSIQRNADKLHEAMASNKSELAMAIDDMIDMAGNDMNNNL
jgi:small-conductance mechanosensitive channel